MNAFLEDARLVELFWARDEAAIAESDAKYGSRLKQVSFNILSSHEDSEECLNDTYLKAWLSIPPQRPCYLFAYLGRIIRNLSFNVLEKRHALKRGGDTLLTELTECIPSQATVEHEIDALELTELLVRWLKGLPAHERILFLRRYWYGDSLRELSDAGQLPARLLSGRLFRLRKALRKFLEQEGVAI